MLISDKKSDLHPMIFFFWGTLFCLFTTGLFNVPMLAWIWPACLLCAFRGIRSQFWLFFSSVVFVLSQILRFWGFSGAGIAADILISVLIGLSLLAPFLLDRILYPKLKEKCGASALLFLPSLLTGIYVISDIFAAAPILGYSQFGFRSLMQITSLIGIHGLTFLLYCFAAVLLYTYDSFREKKKDLRPAAVYAVILCAALVFGGIRILSAKEEPTLTVACALTAAEGEYTDGTLTRPTFEENIAFLHEKAKEAKDADAALLCFAEEAFDFFDADETVYREEFSRTAKENGLPILCTADILDPDGKRRNLAYLYDANGTLVSQYMKTNLLPGPMEADEYQRGSGIPLAFDLETAGGKTINIAAVICFDADYTKYVSKIAGDRELLLVPAWCWRGCSRYQAELMAFRAVENNVSLISPTISAETVYYDRLGRTVCRTAEKDIGRRSLIVSEIPYPAAPHCTVYRIISPWIGWIFPIIAVILPLTLLLPRKKKENN